MASDFSEWRKWRDKLKDVVYNREELIFEKAAKEIAAMLLWLVVNKTPVGQYPKGSGQVGGTLRRGWTAGKHQGTRIYAHTLPVSKKGMTYVIEVRNDVDYAIYVEYGHRTPPKKDGTVGWVPGQKMLTLSEEEVRKAAPQLIEKVLRQQLRGLWD